MPIDYSKWDHIEISDDSDIEVHPNVDKNSFIKWKQRDIHEKRQQRNVEIKSILVQSTMYVKLNERVDYLLENCSDEELLDTKVLIDKLNSKFDKQEKFDYERLIQEQGSSLRKGLKDLTFDKEEIGNTPSYNEMVEDLFTQVKEDHKDAETDASKLRSYISEHRKKIDDVLSKSSTKLDDLLYQKSLLITNDDLHTGFDRSFMNKDDETKPEPKKVKETTIETLNSPSVQSQQVSHQSSPDHEKTEAELLDELTVLPETEKFSTIKSNDLDESAQYLLRNPHICTEQQKDALLMTAFDSQLQGDEGRTRQIIHQSLLLQYIAQLAGPRPNKDSIFKAIKLFIGKIKDDSTPARGAFLQDFENTFKHIVQRCEVLKQEQSSGDSGEALIQLKSLDDDKELSVNLPQEGTPEYEIFSTKLPEEMQEAVKEGSLDRVNEVFAKLPLEEGERILEVFNECGVIGLSGYLSDENEFQELQKQYNENMDLKPTEAVEDTVD
ncbi:Hsp90 co-chaperone Cdc37 [Meyerozyma sp. JA9]|nr:Hsp90 co-chaperone Cdc37 [Meyerozyma sp. JA9]